MCVADMPTCGQARPPAHGMNLATRGTKRRCTMIHAVCIGSHTRLRPRVIAGRTGLTGG